MCFAGIILLMVTQFPGVELVTGFHSGVSLLPLLAFFCILLVSKSTILVGVVGWRAIGTWQIHTFGVLEWPFI